MCSEQAGFRPGVVRGWPGFWIEQPPLRLGVVPEVGGRILSLQLDGEELLFARDERAGQHVDIDSVPDLAARKREIGWCLWGGNKVWPAPQSAWVAQMPPLEMESGRFAATVAGAGIEMTSRICQETGLSVMRRIEVLSAEELRVTSTFTNRSKKVQNWGIWDVTQWLQPAEVLWPCSTDCVRAYANEGQSARLISSRLHPLGFGWAQISALPGEELKFGALIDRGLTVAVLPRAGHTIVLTSRFEVVSGGDYAHDAMVEVYNSGTMPYLEVEFHAPLKPLEPGESVSFAQQWTVRSIDGAPETGELLDAIVGHMELASDRELHAGSILQTGRAARELPVKRNEGLATRAAR